MLIVFFATFDPYYDDFPPTLVIFLVLMTLNYLWGLVFGGMLIFKVRSIPLDLTMPFPLTTTVHHVHQYQPLPQQPQQ